MPIMFHQHCPPTAVMRRDFFLSAPWRTLNCDEQAVICAEEMATLCDSLALPPVHCPLSLSTSQGVNLTGGFTACPTFLAARPVFLVASPFALLRIPPAARSILVPDSPHMRIQ